MRYLSSDLNVYYVVTYFHIVNKYFEFDFVFLFESLENLLYSILSFFSW